MEEKGKSAMKVSQDSPWSGCFSNQESLERSLKCYRLGQLARSYAVLFQGKIQVTTQARALLGRASE
jgi:hypothetical protein